MKISNKIVNLQKKYIKNIACYKHSYIFMSKSLSASKDKDPNKIELYEDLDKNINDLKILDIKKNIKFIKTKKI